MTLHLDPAKTALVLIDLQKGILGRPLAPHSADAIVERGAKLGQRFNALGATIVLVNVAFSPDERDKLVQPVDAPNPPGTPPAGWADLIPPIAALREPLTITKRQWGAFHGTELDLQLRRRGIETIVLAGVATNIGVEQTAREAWQHGYGVVLAEDATSCFDSDWHAFSVTKIMPRIARVRSTDEVLAALAQGPEPLARPQIAEPIK